MLEKSLSNSLKMAYLAQMEETHLASIAINVGTEYRKRRLSDAAKIRGLSKLGNEAYSKQQAERKNKKVTIKL